MHLHTLFLSGAQCLSELSLPAMEPTTPQQKRRPALQLAELAASEDPRAAVAHFRAVDVEADDQDEDGLPWDQVKKFRVRRQTSSVDISVGLYNLCTLHRQHTQGPGAQCLADA